MNTQNRPLIPYSFDVVSLYTSIPIQDAIQNVKRKLQALNIDRLGPFNVEDICSLLDVILTNTYFKFENQLYQQVCGLPMGSAVSGILAILFLDTIEQQALRTFGNVSLFKRYVDDCFLLVSNIDEANGLLNILNEQHPNIRFEMECPTDGQSLSLLDFTVTMSTSNGPRFQFYKKGAKKNIFVHYRSHLPRSAKMAIVANERKRIEERCTSPTDKRRHLNNFKRILLNHGYPNKIIHQKKRNRRRRGPVAEEFLYLKLPFLSDQADRRIKQVFRREGVELRIAHKAQSLRNFLQKKKETLTCQLNNCPVNNRSLCNERHVVYQLQCSSCYQTYIGSTIRPLHLRVKEHCTRRESSVYQHLRQCTSGNISTKVLTKDSDKTNLRIKEAIYIRNLCPLLNSREERDELRDFIFV